VVTFTQTIAGMVTFNPASAALTNASGVASVILYAGSDPGATEISASITNAGSTITSSVGIAVATSNLSLSPLTITPSTLSAGGSAAVSVTVWDESSNPYLPSVPVAFTSSCAQSVPAKAIISATIYTVSGVVSATYRDINCAAIDTITATLAGTTITRSGTVTVTAASAGTIFFVSATPAYISLPGTGGTAQSTVLFRVLDTNGQPIQKQVDFSLDTTVGGITLSTTNPVSSDPTTGNVQTIVQAGSVPTPVRVQAVIHGTTLTSTSDRLTISTGIPTQRAFSLSATTLNIEGWNWDGITSVITARLADRFLNPVPDGTVVNFTASGGHVEASCQTGVSTPAYTPLHGSGECGVYFTSASPRPRTTDSIPSAMNGRVVVLAYALGEESFVDANSNGRFELTETWTDLPEPFVDYNEDGIRNNSEPFIDTNSNGTYTAADGVFNGVLRDASIVGPNQIHVRQSLTIILSGSTAVISATPDPVTLAPCSTGTPFTNTPVTVNVSVADENGNIMPAGTTISVAKTNGTITSPSSFTVGNAAPASGATIIYPITMISDATQGAGPGYTCTNPVTTGYLQVTVKSPKGEPVYKGDIVVND
jgi:hypothetical protein